MLAPPPPLPHNPVPFAEYDLHLTGDPAAEATRALGSYDSPSAHDLRLSADALIDSRFGLLRVARSAARSTLVRPETSTDPLVLVVTLVEGDAALESSSGSVSLSPGESFVLFDWDRLSVTTREWSVLYALYETRDRLRGPLADALPEHGTSFAEANTPVTDLVVSVANVILNARMAPQDPIVDNLRPSIDAAIAAVVATLPTTAPLTLAENARAIIAQRFHEPGFSANELADALHVSRAQLYRAFSHEAHTPAEHIREQRRRAAITAIDRATRLRALDMAAIAHATGYRSEAALRRVLRMTDRRIRKGEHENPEPAHFL